MRVLWRGMDRISGARMRKSFLLRIGAELWDELNRWAHDELRSVNGQIEFVLREAVGRRKGRGKGIAARGGRPEAVDDKPGKRAR